MEPEVIKFRCIPIKKTGKFVSIAVFDPSIAEIKEEIQRIFQHPVEFILTNLRSWEKIFSRLTESFDEIIGSVKEVGSSHDETKEEEIEIVHGKGTHAVILGAGATYANANYVDDTFLGGTSNVNCDTSYKVLCICY